MKEEIINFITKNKLSTADVADALGRKGNVRGICSLNRGNYCVGEVHYIYAWGGSNYSAHKGLAEASSKKVLFFDNIHCGDQTIVGHLMAHYAFTYKKAIAVVVGGNLRDIEKMENMAIWARGFNPIVCTKDDLDAGAAEQFVKPAREKYHGGVMVCDDTGVVLIEPARLNQDTHQRLITIRDREKEWYSKLEKGLSTFDIVCSK